MRHSVLDDERLDSVRMRQCHAKAHRPAVVLHVQRVACEPERLREMVHDLGVVVERVKERFWIGPIAVAEAGIIRRHQMVVLGETREERLEHPR